METFNSFPVSPDADAESRNRELDEKLEPIFTRYQNEGKIVDGKISGSNYSRMLGEIEAQFPDVTASVFNPYLMEYKKMSVIGYKTKPTVRVIRPSSFLGHPAPPSAPPMVNYGDLAGNDDTRKNLQD